MLVRATPVVQRATLEWHAAGLRISCADAFMTDDLIALDRHRGMSAQKATEVRRLLAEVETNAKGLREQQEALEAQLILVPAASWPEAAEKAATCSACLRAPRLHRMRAGKS